MVAGIPFGHGTGKSRRRLRSTAPGWIVMKITKVSQISGKIHTMDIPITPEQYALFQLDRRPIQKIFPNLSADEREFLITGATPGEWEKLFGDNK